MSGVRRAMSFGSLYSVLALVVTAQEPVGKAPEPEQTTVSAPADLSPATAQVSVHPVAHDEQIRSRLQRVLLATDSFKGPEVRVEDGVVFLHGKVESAELKKWASDLARNTQDVVAVANQMEVIEPPVWDFRPAWSGLLVLWRDFMRSSVIRLVKLAFQDHGISMPDEAREVVFPQGVPVTMLDGRPAPVRDARPRKTLPADSPHRELGAVSTKAEAGLSSEALVIEAQARQAQPLKRAENLLPVAPGASAPEKQTNAKPLKEGA